MKKIHYDWLNETLYHEKLDNGLHVYMVPKNGFHKTYVTLSTNLGSLDEMIETDKGVFTLPKGIAHFLEHKLFEQDGKDVSSVFANNQAEVNAFTQHNRTTYLFSCTDQLKQNISTLVDFVQHPKFTTEGIEREKGIIIQEMKMYDDDAGTVSYYGVINNLFKDHPLRHNILGTKESIAAITKDDLEIAHTYFYNPSNMILFVTGNFEPEDIIKHIKTLSFKEQAVFTRGEIEEESVVVTKQSESTTKDILIPNFLLGIKQKGIKDSTKIMKQEITLSILTDLIFGKSSTIHKDMIQKGLINESFGIDITFENSFGLILLGGETLQPAKLRDYLHQLLLNIKDYKLEEKDFNRTKKQIIGGFIHSLNSIEFIANMFTKYHYFGASMFEILDVASTITMEDVEQAKSHFENPESYSDFTVYPKNNA